MRTPSKIIVAVALAGIAVAGGAAFTAAGLTTTGLAAAGLLIAILACAIVSGGVAIVVTQGVSMNPVYYRGYLVVVAKAGSYQIGEIAAYRTPGMKIVALHRIIAGDASGFTFKGDNNQSVDAHHPTADQIVGGAVLGSCDVVVGT